MCGNAETQVLLIFTLQMFNVCAVFYIASKIFGFIRIVAKYILREVERIENGAECKKKDEL